MILPKVASSYRSGVDDASTFVSGGTTPIRERQSVVFFTSDIELGGRNPGPKFPETGQTEMTWDRES